MKIVRNLFDREITCCFEKLDFGSAVLLTGGDLRHIGAVSVAYAQGSIQTVQLPGHKEKVLSETWAQQIAAVTGEPVSVTAGIHYDDLTKEQITEVVRVCEGMLEALLQELRVEKQKRPQHTSERM